MGTASKRTEGLALLLDDQLNRTMALVASRKYRSAYPYQTPTVSLDQLPIPMARLTTLGVRLLTYLSHGDKGIDYRAGL